MKIILLGYMASGKSLIGSELAKIFDVNFIDLDRFIEEKEGHSIQKIFSEKGEIFFRKIENKYLKEVLDLKTNLVLSLGGGTPCFSNNLELIKASKNSKSIYLNVSVNELANRLMKAKNIRPMVAHVSDKNNMLEFVGKHLFERFPFYNQANYNIEASKPKEEVIEDIIMKLF